MLYVLDEFLKGNRERAVEIDAEVIDAMFSLGGKRSFYEIVKKFNDDDLKYALVRWGFIMGIKAALTDVEAYEHLLIVLNALANLGCKDGLKELLRAELEGDGLTLGEIRKIKI